MRNFIILTIILINVLACDNSEDSRFTGNTDIFLFIDITDSLYSNINEYDDDLNKIFEKMGLDEIEGGIAGGQVSLFLLNDTSSEPVGNIKLKKGTDNLFDERSNKHVRIDEIDSFKNEIKVVLAEILNTTDWKKSNSKIYQQLCRELNRIVRFSMAEQKIFIIYSDMLEHSNLFSFYRKGFSKMERLMESKDRVSIFYDKELSVDCKLPTIEEGINEIEIYCIPKRTKENDEKINLAEKFWIHLLTEKGIKKIRFKSDLDFK